MRIKFLLSLVVVFLFSMAAYGQTVTWTGAVNNDIGNPNNWTTNRLPIAPRNGIINTCNTCPTLLNAPIALNSIVVNGGTINLNSFELTTTTLSITSGKINSNNGKLITGNLSQMRGGTFIGDISIIVNGRGVCFGKNIFQDKLYIELGANAGGNLVLNQSETSTYVGKCHFVNNSIRSLVVASYPFTSGDLPTIFQNSCEFTNNSTGVCTVSSRPKINFIETASFTNNNGSFTAFVGASTNFSKPITVFNRNGTFTLATGTSTVSGVSLAVINGGTTNLLSGGAIGTFNSVSLTNTASNGIIITALATANNQLNINNSLSVIFANNVNNTINLNKVICGASATAVAIGVLPSANLNINSSTFNDLSITNNSNLNINSSTFNELSVTDNSNNLNNLVTINKIICAGNFLLTGTSSVATNIVGANTFNKNITIDKSVNIGDVNNNINNISLGTDNQFINSNNNVIISIPRLRLSGKTTINTLVNITNRLAIGGIVDCLSGTLSDPKLSIADGAIISNAGANAFIMGAVKKIGVGNSFIFPVGTIRTGKTPENKYTPLTLLATMAFLPADFITVVYVPSASTRPNLTIIASDYEYWGFNSNFDGQRRFSLGNILNFCTTKDNGTGLRAFHWADNIGNWTNITTNINTSTQTITSTNTPLGFVNFKANKNNEIALGYESLLKLDLTEVAVKNFTLTGTNIVLASILPPSPLASFKSDGIIFITPQFVGTRTTGTLTLNFNNPITDPISSTIDINIIKTGLLNTTQIANTNNDINFIVNSQRTTLNNFYTITNASSREATIKFYKLPQTAPSTALGITSNLVNGIKLNTDLTFAFASPSQFKLEIYDTTNPLPLFTSSMPTLASSLTWTPSTLASGTYKFTLKNLVTSKVYNGQFIKQ